VADAGSKTPPNADATSSKVAEYLDTEVVDLPRASARITGRAAR
jgi:hypothetical protein